MARVGFNLVKDSLLLLEDGDAERIEREPFFKYDKPYVFLRDVDTEPVVLDDESVFPKLL